MMGGMLKLWTAALLVALTAASPSAQGPAKKRALRAASVVAYLAKAGIAPGRLQSRGFGESQPVAPNDTDKNRLLNRRVEFVILSR